MDNESKKYLRLFRIAEQATKYLPAGLAYTIMRYNAMIFSPDRGKIETKKISRIMGLPLWKARIVWYKYLQNQGIFFANIFLHKTMDQHWLTKHVRIENQELLSILKDTGGLVLTWHTQYQHTLAVILGLSGLKINALALAPEESSFYIHLKKYIDLLHNESEKKFSGRYIFYRQNHIFKRQLYRVLSNQQVLISLNDNIADSNRSVSVTLLKQKVDIMHGTVDVALNLKKPIIAALPFFSGNNFILKLKQLDTSQDVQTIMQTYMTVLDTEIQKQPELWEGWHWL
jgi:lauroyl/myristoyl acyltransferase